MELVFQIQIYSEMRFSIGKLEFLEISCWIRDRCCKINKTKIKKFWFLDTWYIENIYGMDEIA